MRGLKNKRARPKSGHNPQAAAGRSRNRERLTQCAGSVIRIPTEPQTIGDHIRKRRLELKMLQREVADEIGVDKTSVFN